MSNSAPANTTPAAPHPAPTSVIPAGSGPSSRSPEGRVSTINAASSANRTRALAYANGYAQGWAAGTQAGSLHIEQQRRQLAVEKETQKQALESQYQQKLAALAAAVRACEATVAPVLTEASMTMTAGAIELAQAIIGVELSDRSRAAHAALERVSANVGHGELLRIRVNPRDFHAFKGMDLPDGVETVPDESLEPGDAVGELVEGLIDARLGSAIQRVRDLLLPGSSTGGELQ